MTNHESERPVVSTGSLFKTSEGILVTALCALCGHVVEGDFAPMVQVAAISALGVVVAAYALSRAKTKS